MGRASRTAAAVPKDGERRKTILRAAVEVFAKKGYHGCRIADVAREAGVAYGLVYHYFQNKEELLASVFDAAWSGFLSRVRGVIEGGGSLEERVRGVVAVAFEAYRADPRGVRVLILEIARSPGGRVNRQTAFVEVMELVRGLFLSAQKKGELRPDVDPLLCATLLWGAIEMGLTAFVLRLDSTRSDESVERAKTQVADAFLFGVLPRDAEVTWAKEKSATRSRAKRPS